MSINDIYDLPVNTICSNDCILFIWVIDPMLPEAMEVIKRWGFKYKTVKQLIISKRQEHSKKPDEIRNRIIQLCGDLPKIELFARQRVKGWDCWGNQV
jgi:site-specific DNA-methyltransferase (adenine-specific)